MLALTDAQVWTVIGLFAAGMSALIAMTLRIVTVEIGALRREMNIQFEHMNSDIQAIAKRVFPEP